MRRRWMLTQCPGLARLKPALRSARLTGPAFTSAEAFSSTCVSEDEAATMVAVSARQNSVTTIHRVFQSLRQKRFATIDRRSRWSVIQTLVTPPRRPLSNRWAVGSIPDLLT